MVTNLFVLKTFCNILHLFHFIPGDTSVSRDENGQTDV